MAVIKRMRVVIPTIQVVLWLASALLHNILGKYYVTQPDVITGYADNLMYILLKLSYPLAVLWFLLLYPLDLVFSASHLTRPVGVSLVATAIAFDVAALASIAVFWHFVIVEIEKRKSGHSLIRFSSRTLETAKAIVLVAAGVGAFVIACWEAHRLVPLDERYRHVLYWSNMVNAVVGGLCLLTWATVLIAISIKDLKLALRGNEKNLRTEGCP